ncbi:hypothetical protein D3C81_1534620 [compost metagenome]
MCLSPAFRSFAHHDHAADHFDVGFLAFVVAKPFFSAWLQLQLGCRFGVDIDRMRWSFAAGSTGQRRRSGFDGLLPHPIRGSRFAQLAMPGERTTDDDAGAVGGCFWQRV